jgi:ABC-type Fe3+-siderophore transport system permease subunit
MKKFLFNIAGFFGMLVILTVDLSAETLLGSISTFVIIFTSLSGAAIWLYAVKKRRDLDE